MSKRAKFEPGDTVHHLVKNTTGNVKEGFLTGDGWWYHLEHSGWMWSAPESGLKLYKKNSNRFNGLQNDKLSNSPQAETFTTNQPQVAKRG